MDRARAPGGDDRVLVRGGTRTRRAKLIPIVLARRDVSIHKTRRPLFPQQRTFVRSVGMSAKGQKPTSKGRELAIARTRICATVRMAGFGAN